MTLHSSDIGIYPCTSVANIDSAVTLAVNAGGGIVSLPPSLLVGTFDYSNLDIPLTFHGVKGLSGFKWPDHHTTTGSTRTGDYGRTSNALLRLGSNSSLIDLVMDGNLGNQSPATTSEGCNGIVTDTKTNIKICGVEVKNMVHAGIALYRTVGVLLDHPYIHDSYIGDQTIWPDWTYEHPLGIYIRRGAGAVFDCNTRVIGAVITNVGLDCIQSWGGNLEILGGRFDRAGIGMEHWNGATPNDGQVQGACGIYITGGADNVRVVGATCTNCTESGIGVAGQSYGASNIVLQGCIVKDNDNDGVHFVGVDTVSMSNCQVINSGARTNTAEKGCSLYVQDVTNLIAQGNQLLDKRTPVQQSYGVNTYNGANTNIKIRDNIIKAGLTSAFKGTDYTSVNTVI